MELYNRSLNSTRNLIKGIIGFWRLQPVPRKVLNTELLAIENKGSAVGSVALTCGGRRVGWGRGGSLAAGVGRDEYGGQRGITR